MPLLVMAPIEYATLTDLAGTDLLVDAPADGFVVALQAMLDDVGVALDLQAFRRPAACANGGALRG